jgi:hypothetical protein
MDSGNRQILPPHPISTAAQAYIDAMTPQQKKLHELAIVALGSSYFVEQSRGFIAFAKDKRS